MADNTTLNTGSGGDVIASDDIAGVKHQRVKVEYGSDGSATDVDASNRLPVGGTELAAIQTAIEILDNIVSGSEAQVDVLTVPAPLSTTGGGTEAAALRVTLANDSTGVVSVDDGGGALTIDGTVTANVGTGTQAVSGTITANLSASDNAVLDNIQTAVEIIDNVVSGSEAQCDVITQPARVHTTDRISAAIDSSVIMDGTTAMTPAFDSIDAAASGDNTLLVAQGAGNKIRVVSAFLVSAGAVNVRFESGASGTALTGQMNLVANTGFVLPYNPAGWFETADNTLLNLELSAAVSVDGAYTYVVV